MNRITVLILCALTMYYPAVTAESGSAASKVRAKVHIQLKKQAPQLRSPQKKEAAPCVLALGQDKPCVPVTQKNRYAKILHALKTSYKAALDVQPFMRKLVLFAEVLFQNKVTPSSAAKGPITQQIKEDTPFALALQRANAHLKHVPTNEKNLYAKMIRGLKAPYDASLDVQPFIRKLAIDDGFGLTNTLTKSVFVEALFLDKKTSKLSSSGKLRIKPGTSLNIPKPAHTLFHSIQLVGPKSANLHYGDKVFLNPKFLENGLLQIFIEEVEDRFFLHQYHNFDFTSKAFSPSELEQPGLSDADKAFRKDFNNCCDFLNFAGFQEGVSLASINAQRRELYAKNNFARLCKWEPDVLDGTTHKIPLVTHKIWVTSDDLPKDPSPQYIKWLESSIANNNEPSSGWKHYFWIESKKKLPKLAALLEGHPTIILRELSEVSTQFKTADLYKEAIRERKFGKATDIIRLELLGIFGGFYLDTDYELFQSLIPYAKAYHMIVGLEPMSAYLCNAFIGSCPNHPVINRALAMITRNLSTQAPDYVKNAPDNGFKTIVETGPAMFTFAFALAGGLEEYTDIVLPPQMLYPAQSDTYPSKQVVVPRGKIPASALGAHYWNTAWMDPQFGSKG